MEKNSSKLKSIVILVLLILLVLSALLYSNGKLYNKSGTAFAGREFVLAGELNSMSSKNSWVYFVDDMLLEVQSQTIKAKSIDASTVWNVRMPGLVNKLCSAGENLIVVDSTRVLSCLSKKGKLLWSFNLPYDCMEIYAQPNGTILIEYKNSSGCRFEVLDKKGGKLGSGLVENAYLLSFSSGGLDMFTISVLDVSSDSVKSKVLTYNFKGDIVWANNFDNEIIASVAYGKNNNLIVLGDRSIYKYKPNGTLAAKQELKGGVASALTDGQLSVITTRDMGELKAVCFDGNLKKTGSIALDKTPEGMYISRNSFVLFDKDEFDLYDMKGNKLAVYNSPVDILGIHIMDDNKFYLVSNRKLQLLESR